MQIVHEKSVICSENKKKNHQFIVCWIFPRSGDMEKVTKINLRIISKLLAHLQTR